MTPHAHIRSLSPRPSMGRFEALGARASLEAARQEAP
jgi:hypothetical protein